MPTNYELEKRSQEQNKRIKELERELKGLIIVELPLPTGRGKSVVRMRRIALELRYRTRPDSRNNLLWYLGWKVGQALYLYGVGFVWRGLKDFLLAPQSLRNQTGPDPTDLLALVEYRVLVEKEVGNGSSR